MSSLQAARRKCLSLNPPACGMLFWAPALTKMSWMTGVRQVRMAEGGFHGAQLSAGASWAAEGAGSGPEDTEAGRVPRGVACLTRAAPFLSLQEVPVRPAGGARPPVGGGAPGSLGPARQHLAEGPASAAETSEL